MARKDPEAERAYQAAYRATNIEQRRAYYVKYYADNFEKRTAAIARCKAANPGKYKDIMRAVRHRRRGRMVDDPSNNATACQQADLLAKSKHCYLCKRPWTKTRRPTLDHVIAIAAGGSNTISNCAAACLSCNSSKGARPYDPHTGQLLLI